MNWLRALEEARTVEAVLDVANDYLAQQAPAFWSAIPERAQPETIADEEDLHRWHQRLVDELTATRSAHVHLQDLCVFFVRASVRAHQIRLREERGGPSNDREFSAAAPRLRR